MPPSHKMLLALAIVWAPGCSGGAVGGNDASAAAADADVDGKLDEPADVAKEADATLNSDANTVEAVSDSVCSAASSGVAYADCSGGADCAGGFLCVPIAFGGVSHSVCEPTCGDTCPCANGAKCLVQGQGADQIASCSPPTCPDWLAEACDDSNVCTTDLCDPQIGCSHMAMSAATACDDSSKCTTNDHCGGGTCAGVLLSAALCNDGNACTDDSCESAVGCVHNPSGVACNDGEACTTGDYCQAGACIGAKNLCGCLSSKDCSGIDDGNACNGVAFCDKSLFPYACGLSASVACDTTSDGPCAATMCEPSTGKCSVTAKANNVSCADDACKPAVCANGSCLPTTALKCDDANACTADSCSPTLGCQHAAIVGATKCDDHDACTSGDACVGALCAGKALLSCDDGNPCTVDSCAPASGCINSKSGNSCDDANACTDDSCEPTKGCQHAANAASCSDGDACTGGDVCTGAKCAGTAIVCTALDQCHLAGKCIAQACSNPPKTNGTTCDDGNVCTMGDACTSGSCSGPGLNCDDANACTTDTCNASGACVHSTSVNCDDGNACTTDSCNAVGCQHINNTAACNDGSACTSGDVCSAGACQGTPNSCGNGKCDCGENALACATDCATPGMVALPSGTFTMGLPASKASNFDEEPEHQVTLSAFEMDKAEVTVAQYTTFYNQLASGQKCSKFNQSSFLCGNPATSDYPAYPGMAGCNFGGAGQHPITCVDWFQADAYCSWAHVGGRLPTEAEWEYAARSGGKSPMYPWGDTLPSCSYVVWDELSFGCNTGSEWPTCSKAAGNSSQGICDLAGNVEEWCSDWYDKYPAAAQTNPTGSGSGGNGFKVVRGGSWFDTAADRLTVAYRNYSTTPSWRYPGLGFRCARTL